MPKPKQFLKESKKKSKHAPQVTLTPTPTRRLPFYNFSYEGHGELTSRLGFGQVPTTADEYLAGRP